jgi:hypothetical protein
MIVADEWVKRLFSEHDELKKSIDKLESFILTREFDLLDDIDKHDLREQHQHMYAYYRVLQRRTARLVDPK